jgi:hypothetical protein
MDLSFNTIAAGFFAVLATFSGGVFAAHSNRLTKIEDDNKTLFSYGQRLEAIEMQVHDRCEKVEHDMMPRGECSLTSKVITAQFKSLDANLKMLNKSISTLQHSQSVDYQKQDAIFKKIQEMQDSIRSIDRQG